MSRSDIPITCLIRYTDVARLQLSHFCCPDTTPWLGCLCDCLICVTVTVTTFALVTFHTDLVCTVHQVMGPRLTSLTRDNLVRRATIATSPAKASSHSNLVLSPCSRRYRQHKLRFKTHPTSQLKPKSAARGRQTATHTDALGAHKSKMEKGGGGGALLGEYTYTWCTIALG
jgi:hypothetical protein